ncbi:hypothetical protein [Nocardia blacklockiae]|uniref:hypothetical protein n=1 Tax=Nocardia blacklockiae TaxID=480036 RepID=UPI001894DFCA|nr:hypothetical protein [Nocardia blacklockiae]MBF6172249.1 hypothetical protein [Nocardia blacklockiae]
MTRDLPTEDDDPGTGQHASDAAYRVATGVARVARAGAYVTGGALIASNGSPAPTNESHTSRITGLVPNDPHPDAPSPVVTYPDPDPDSVPPPVLGKTAPPPAAAPAPAAPNQWAAPQQDGGFGFSTPDGSFNGGGYWYSHPTGDGYSPSVTPGGSQAQSHAPGSGHSTAPEYGDSGTLPFGSLSDPGFGLPGLPGLGDGGFDLPGYLTHPTSGTVGDVASSTGRAAESEDSEGSRWFGVGEPHPAHNFGPGLGLPGTAGLHLPGMNGLGANGFGLPDGTDPAAGHAFDGIGDGHMVGVFFDTESHLDAHIGLDGIWITGSAQLDIAVGDVGQQLDHYGDWLGGTDPGSSNGIDGLLPGLGFTHGADDGSVLSGAHAGPTPSDPTTHPGSGQDGFGAHPVSTHGGPGALSSSSQDPAAAAHPGSAFGGPGGAHPGSAVDGSAGTHSGSVLGGPAGAQPGSAFGGPAGTAHGVAAEAQPGSAQGGSAHSGAVHGGSGGGLPGSAHSGSAGGGHPGSQGLAAGAPVPGAAAGAMAPGAVAPGAVAPGAVSPGAVAPGAAPGAVAPGVVAPGVVAPAVAPAALPASLAPAPMVAPSPAPMPVVAVAQPITAVPAPVAPPPPMPVIAQPVAATPLQTTIQPEAASHPIANVLVAHAGPSPLTVPAFAAPALFDQGPERPGHVGTGKPHDDASGSPSTGAQTLTGTTAPSTGPHVGGSGTTTGATPSPGTETGLPGLPIFGPGHSTTVTPTEPGTTRPDVTTPDTTRPDVTTPDTTRPDASTRPGTSTGASGTRDSDATSVTPTVTLPRDTDSDQPGGAPHRPTTSDGDGPTATVPTHDVPSHEPTASNPTTMPSHAPTVPSISKPVQPDTGDSGGIATHTQPITPPPTVKPPTTVDPAPNGVHPVKPMSYQADSADAGWPSVQHAGLSTADHGGLSNPLLPGPDAAALDHPALHLVTDHHIML